VPGVRFKQSIRCDSSPLRHRLELFGGKRALFVSVCVSVKIVGHWFLSVKRVEGKNGKRQYHRQDGGTPCYPKRISLCTTREPCSNTHDNEKDMPSHRNPASSVHDIPLTETHVFTEYLF